jgi:hypothetical protein
VKFKLVTSRLPSCACAWQADFKSPAPSLLMKRLYNWPNSGAEAVVEAVVAALEAALEAEGVVADVVVGLEKARALGPVPAYREEPDPAARVSAEPVSAPALERSRQASSLDATAPLRASAAREEARQAFNSFSR